MSHHVAFHEAEWLVPDSVIPGNSEAENPCRFNISMASDDDYAKLKSILVGTIGLTPDMKWTPAVQKMVSGAFVHGRDAFVRTVDKVDGLTVDAKLARKVGILPPYVAGATDISGLPDDAPFPIKSGYHFSRIAPYQILIAFLLATEIIKLTDKGNIDPRFFDQLSGSSIAVQRANSVVVNGTAPSVNSGRGNNATAASQKAKRESRRAGTSNRRK